MNWLDAFESPKCDLSYDIVSVDIWVTVASTVHLHTSTAGPPCYCLLEQMEGGEH